MKGDFTRNTFKPQKHYSGVRMQQGRVQVDADFNEYVDIQAHLDHTALGDIIGLCGGPQDNAGFGIKVTADGLSVTKGRYYVDGILCENDDNVLLAEQPDLPGQTHPAAPGTGFYLAYLDVWQRHITALEDKEIREVALGGPDTATRTKTIWQVKLIHAAGEFNLSPLCSDPIFKSAWDAVTKPSSGLLTAGVETSKEDQSKPCIVPARAGYRGLENQLYRVEVHTADTGKETFKWSRENGSVVFPIKFDKVESGKSHVTLTRLAKDKVLSLHADDLVEISGDTTELNGKPGIIVKVLPESEIDKGSIVLDADVSKYKDEANLKVRRWDHKANDKVTLASDRAIPIQEGKTVPLEDGVQITFEKSIGTVYHTGDYWLIPARTATRDIEWPQESGHAVAQPPQGITHHFCRLAVLSYDGNVWKRIHDCRRLFPPLTEMISFAYVGGDGQEAMPGNPLPKPLQVSVVSGLMRVADAKVQFKVIGDSGYVKEYKNEADCLGFTAGGTTTVTVQTGADGIASACWRLDDDNLSEQVEATLIEVDGKPMVETVEGKVVPFLPPIRFNANLSVAWEVAYNSHGCTETQHPQAATVQVALDQLYCNAALYYVGGDGQEALPGSWLPQPLQVRVANGKWPVADAEVVFMIEEPGKGLVKTEGMQGKKVVARTNGSGLASCLWQLDNDNSSQQVRAFLANVEQLPIYFNANTASRGSSCCVAVGPNGEYRRLDEAIMDLWKNRKQVDICLCLLPGKEPQVLPGDVQTDVFCDSEVSISISGCGMSSRIVINDPMKCVGLQSFAMKDVVIEFKRVIDSNNPGLVFRKCGSVSFESCHVFGITDVSAGGALLSIGTTDRVQLRNNTFEAISNEGKGNIFKPITEFNDKTADGTTSIVSAASANDVTLDRSAILKYASDLSAMKDEDRANLANNLIAMTAGDSAKTLSRAEVVNIANLGRALNAKADDSIVSTLLNNIRRATLKSHPGVALILGESINQKLAERDDMIILENNEIVGVICLYDSNPVLGERVIGECLAKLKGPWQESKEWEIIGLQGTLEIRGNRLVGITVGKDIPGSLEQPVDSGDKNWRLNIFARCVLSENVIEGVSLIVSQDLALTTNDFVMSAVASTKRQVIQAGGAIADSSVYVGNQGCRSGIAWSDISHVSKGTANARMNIV